MVWIEVGIMLVPMGGALILNDARLREIAGIDAAIDEERPWRSRYAINHEYLPLVTGLLLMAAMLGAGIMTG